VRQGQFHPLTPALVPYSRYRTEVKLRAVQMSAWGYRTYRRTGQALGVRSMTVYPGPEARTGPGPEARTGCWVSAWGYELLAGGRPVRRRTLLRRGRRGREVRAGAQGLW
jgi:hypothetical protein